MLEIKTTLGEALSIGENCYSAADGGQGAAFFKLPKTIELMISNQEKCSPLWWMQ
jgi:hypothetical protein